MRRKGQVFDILPVVMGCLIFAACLVILYIIYSAAGNSGIQVLDENMAKGKQMLRGMDLVVPSTLIGMIFLTVLLIGWLRMIPGAWVLVLLFTVVLLLFVSPVANGIEAFLASDNIASFAADFPMTSFLVAHMQLVVGLWGILLSIFAGMKPEGPGYG